MAVVSPFRALRPEPRAAAAVAAVPYDVVSTEEARALAADVPLSFLHVTRPEIDLAPGTDPHDPVVYETARANLVRVRRAAPLVAHLADGKGLSADDIAELEALLGELKK